MFIINELANAKKMNKGDVTEKEEMIEWCEEIIKKEIYMKVLQN